MAASEELRKHKLSPLPGATSEVWKYFGFEKDGKLVDRREVSAKYRNRYGNALHMRTLLSKICITYVRLSVTHVRAVLQGIPPSINAVACCCVTGPVCFV